MNDKKRGRGPWPSTGGSAAKFGWDSSKKEKEEIVRDQVAL